MDCLTLSPSNCDDMTDESKKRLGLLFKASIDTRETQLESCSSLEEEIQENAAYVTFLLPTSGDEVM